MFWWWEPKVMMMANIGSFGYSCCCNFGHLLCFFSSSAPFLFTDFWGWPLLWCSRFGRFLRTAVAAQFLVDCNVKLCEANQFYFSVSAAAATPLHWGERKNLFIRDFGLWKSKYFLANSLIHLSWKERRLGEKKKKTVPNNVAIVSSYSCPLYSGLIVFYTRTPTGIGMERGALALHLLKPLARENAQPSEDYVCTISKPGTTSKTNGLLHIRKIWF